MKRSEWHHTSLAVSDLDAAVRFFREAFGFREVFRAELPVELAALTGRTELAGDLAQLRAGEGPRLELIAFRGAPEAPAAAAPVQPGQAHVAFVVDDLDAALERLGALGAEPLGEVVAFSEGRSVYCRVPGGSFVELEQLVDPPTGGSPDAPPTDGPPTDESDAT